MQTGRWTILSRATSLRRRPSSPYVRARVHVTCVCGHRGIVWLEDIERGASTGCASRRCKARFEASRDVRTWLTGWALEQLSGLERLARDQPSAELARGLLRFAREQYDARVGELEQRIAGWLKAPLDVDLDACEGL